MDFAGTPRPAPRWHHAESELDDFVIVSFRVPAERLAALLPPGFAPVRFDWAAGAPLGARRRRRGVPGGGRGAVHA